MRVVYLGIGYPVKGDQNIYTDLMRYFVREGHDVSVVCSDTTILEKDYCVSKENGIEVIRIQTGAVIGNVSIIKKGLSTLLIDSTFLHVVKKVLKERHYDLILCSTPPITIVHTIDYLKRKHKCPVYLMLKDIFPQNAVDLGMMSTKGFIYRYFRHMERRLYRLSDYIGCMSPANIQYVLDHNPEIPKNKLSLCVNSISSNEECEIDKSTILDKYGIGTNRITFLYGGSLGVPQGIDFLIEYLGTQVNKEDRFFVICGKGKEAWKISKFLENQEIDNILYFDWMPFEDYEILQKACDVGIVLLNNKFTIPNFPSRLLSITRNHKPVLAATDIATDLGQIVTNGKFGWWCRSNDARELAKITDEICKNPKQISEYGFNAYRYYSENYTVRNTYDQIMEAIEER